MHKIFMILGMVVLNISYAFAEDFCSSGYEVQSSKIVDGQNCVNYTCKGDKEVKMACSGYGMGGGIGIAPYTYQSGYLGGYGVFGQNVTGGFAGLDPQTLKQWEKQQQYFQEQIFDDSVCFQECKNNKDNLLCKKECRVKQSKERENKRSHSLENCKMSDDERFISCPNGEYEKKSSTVEASRSDSPNKELFNSKRNSDRNKSVIKE